VRATLLTTIFLGVLLLGGSADAATTTAGECGSGPMAGSPMDPFMSNLNQIFAAGQSRPAAPSLRDAQAAAKDRIRALTPAGRETLRCGLPPDANLLRKYRHGEHLSPSEFIALVAPLAQRAEQTTGVPASVTIAQAIQETGFGKSAHAAGNNLFGIKGSGDAGSLRLSTKEFVHGHYVTIRASFAAYRSLEDSVVAHARFVTSGYFKNTSDDLGSPTRFVSQIARDGYATDPHYASELDGLISRYDLTRFDDSSSCSGSAATDTVKI
jgi:flagellum-specific peptidoglycan hydrolase FlgJ